MKTHLLAVVLGLAVVVSTAAHAADLNVTGNLTVTGSIDSDANTTSFGAQSTTAPTIPAVMLTYTDNSVDSLKFLINRNPASWLWLKNTGTIAAPVYVNAMRLDSAHQLILYNAAGTTAGVSLTPASNRISLGTATLTGSGANLTTGGALTVTSGLTNTNGTLTGGATGLTLNAGGTNQNITLTPSGTGNLILLPPPGTGKVGIGTTAPGQKLAVSGANGTPAVTGSAADGVARFGSSVTNLVLDFGVSGGAPPLAWLQARDQTSYVSNYNLALNPNGGNLGIGTTNPTRLFSINGAANAYLGFKVADVLQSTIGSDANADFFVFDDQTSAYRFVVNTTGNVGIGTISPQSPLHVVGGYSAVRVDSNTGGNAYGDVAFYSGAIRTAGIRSHNATSTYPNLLELWSETGNISLSNNVGIGTGSPGNKLHVMGAVTVEGGQSAIFHKNSSGIGVALTGVRNDVAGEGNFSFYGYNAANWIFWNGNVGIGTTSPNAKLAVAGEVTATGNVTTRGGPTSYNGFGEVSLGLPASDLDMSRPNLSSGNGIYRINHHTGLSFSAHSYYGGIRFYNQGYSGTNPNPYDSTTGATLAMSIVDGYVGIGTPTPAALLHVKSPTGPLAVRFEGQTNAYASRLYLSSVTSGDGGLQYDANDNTMSMFSYGDVKFHVGTGNISGAITNERMRITQSGNVGIGTTAPAKKLHVAGTGSMQVDPDDGSIELASGNDGMSYIDFKGSTNLGSDYRGRMLYADGTGFTFSTGQSYTNEMVIREGGNVGIGTTNPGLYKLAVNGTIHAKEIIVDNTNWADYVFDSNYRLAPLSEVESHIKAEKHLPGIPSAAEIAEHGVSMGDMQSKLLSKIEELTLHMIAQEKRIEKLEQENRQLRTAVVTP